MVSSFLISLVFLILAKNGIHFSTHAALLTTIAFTTVCWVTTAFVGPVTDRQVLIDFYAKVRPFGPGWRKVQNDAGLVDGWGGPRAEGDNIPLALLGWVAGCTMIWSSLFTVGNFLYGRMTTALFLLATFVVSATALVYVVQRLWSGSKAEADAEASA